MKRIIPVIQEFSKYKKPSWRIIKEINDNLEGLGYYSKEINIDKPWGGYISFYDNNVNDFIEAFYDKNIELAQLNNNISPKLLILEPNAKLSLQYHDRRHEIWCFLTDGKYVDDDNIVQVAHKGSVIKISSGQKHRLIGAEKNNTIVAELWYHTDINNLSDEDDITRLADIYGRKTVNYKKKGSNMKVVILAGGEGTRLWPISTYDKPKQFMKLIDKSRSLLKATYDRVSDEYEDIYVVSQEKQKDIVRDQIPELKDDHIITIPKNKDTALGILVALDYLSRHHSKDDDVISFIPSDHYITEEERFNETLYKAGEVAKEEDDITLIGLKITYPATQFGYIHKSSVSGRNFYDVIDFKEKPDYQTALEYQKSGKYYWNSGMFVAKLETFISSIKKYNKSLYDDYKSLTAVKDIYSDEYLQKYNQLDGRSIDYELIERVKGLKVVEADFNWMDVGSFKQIYNLSDKDENENYYNPLKHYLMDVKGSYIRTDSDKPVAVIGLKNVVVVETKDGILIADMSMAEEAGKISKLLHNKKVKRMSNGH